MPNQLWLWIIFNAFVVTMLIVDQLVFHRKAHTITMKEALGWSFFWISLALLFNIGIFFFQGSKAALEFLTGYLIELSLSVDNLFVFMVIFSYFQVPVSYQHRVLFWGIVGAQIMRGLFIVAGVVMIHVFHWLIYVFGVFLVLTGIKMALQKEEDIHPERNPVFLFIRRFLPVTEHYEGDKFFLRRNAKWIFTPLFVVLLVIDIVDFMFALDSIPAILAITLNSFIVYSSNVFAILGLRTFYFVLARFMQLFHYLNYGLSFILVFVGIKMLLADIYPIPVVVALGTIVVTLAISVIASLAWPKPQTLPSSKRTNE